MQPVRTPIGAILALVISAIAAAAPPAPVLHRMHFKAPRPLVLDVDRIAVRLDGAAPGAVAGIDLSVGADLPVPGWRLVPLPPARRDADAVARVLRDVVDAAPDLRAAPVFVDDLGGPLVPLDDLLVRFEPGTTDGAARTILAAHGAGTVIESTWGGLSRAYRVRAAARDGFAVLAAANALAARPDVRFAEPAMLFTGRSSGLPDDPYFPSLWGLHNTGQTGGVPDVDMDAPEAWEISDGDPSILVAVLDVGVEWSHPDLAAVSGADTTSQGPGTGAPRNSCDSHGTAVAGCVSSVADNALGTAGIAPGCRVFPVRIMIASLDCSGNWTSTNTWTVNGIDAAQTAGARVTNNSNDYGFQSAAIADKYADSRAAGMIHFAASGNQAGDPIDYPSSLPSVNAVGSIDDDGDRSSFSQFGPGLAYVAPGRDIWTTDRTGVLGWVNDDYAEVTGTSFASPYAAGVAALVLSTDPLLTPDDVEQILDATAVDLGDPGPDDQYGAGLVNARLAIECGLSCDLPRNDACADAPTVADGAYAFVTDLAETDGPSESACLGGSGVVARDLWYRYVAPCSGTVTAGVCGADFDSRLAVYDDFCPVAANQAIACGDDECGDDASVSFPVAGGVTYYLRVGGAAGADGAGTLSITGPTCVPPPPNDGCGLSTAITDGSAPVDTTGAVTDGPTETGCPAQAEADVWFRWFSPCAGPVTVSVDGADFDAVLAIYGALCPSGPDEAIDCEAGTVGAGPSITFAATASTLYRFRVGGVGGATGTATITVACPPDCPADTNGDDAVDVTDLVNVILDWATDGTEHGGDVDGSGFVDVEDLVAVVVAWGGCT